MSPEPSTPLDRRLCVAPMMAWTDQHCRHLHRLFAPGALLYTEMVTADALLRGDRDRWLNPGREEHPVALQIGGSEPATVAAAAELGAEAGYDEINLNVGCPSDRVQNGRFGACLMTEPERVAAIAHACQERIAVPFTVKCRLGVDHHDDYDFFRRFVDTVAAAGVNTFIVHARIAILSGLSPAQNRSVPPLRYGCVERLRSERSDLTLVLNGGIDNTKAALDHLQSFDGVMLGRTAYHHPEVIAAIDGALHGHEPVSSTVALERYMPYIEAQLSAGTELRHITRHLLHLFHGVPGARRYRRHLTEYANAPGAGAEVLADALQYIPGAIAPVQATA